MPRTLLKPCWQTAECLHPYISFFSEDGVDVSLRPQGAVLPMVFPRALPRCCPEEGCLAQGKPTAGTVLIVTWCCRWWSVFAAVLALFTWWFRHSPADQHVEVSKGQPPPLRGCENITVDFPSPSWTSYCTDVPCIMQTRGPCGQARAWGG